MEVGSFEELEWLPGPGIEEGGLTEVDRSPQEGWVWVVQQAAFPEPKAITVWVRLRQPGGEAEERRLVLLCQGGVVGAGS